MSKIASILYYTMMVISIIIGILFYVGPSKMTAGMVDPDITSPALQYMYFLLAFSVLIAIILPVINAIRNPKNIVRNLLMFVGAVILFGVCYYFSKGDILPLINYEGSDNVPWVLKLVDMGLFVMYITFAVAILAIIVSEIRRYLL